MEHLLEGRTNPGELRWTQCSWMTRRGGARIHPFPDLIWGLAVEIRGSCWRSLLIWGLPKVSGFSSFFFCGCSVWACPHLLWLKFVLPLYYCCIFHCIITLHVGNIHRGGIAGLSKQKSGPTVQTSFTFAAPHQSKEVAVKWKLLSEAR